MLSSSAPPLDADEAILDDTGELREATGRARDPASRELLRTLVDRAVGSLSATPRRTTDMEDVWAAILAGRWSLVGRFELDGHLHFVARRAPSGFPDPRALSEPELEVARWAAEGRSQKWIALELEIPERTVGDRLESIQRKLGLRNRIELVRVLAAMRA